MGISDVAETQAIVFTTSLIYIYYGGFILLVPDLGESAPISFSWRGGMLTYPTKKHLGIVDLPFCHLKVIANQINT